MSGRGRCHKCPACGALYSWHEEPGICTACLLGLGCLVTLVEVPHEKEPSK